LGRILKDGVKSKKKKVYRKALQGCFWMNVKKGRKVAAHAALWE